MKKPTDKAAPSAVIAARAVEFGGELRPPPPLPVIHVTTHRELAAAARQVAARIAAHPEFSPMFAINPVLTLERYGVRLTPELQDHVLRSTRHPPAVYTRRKALEASLTQALGEAPKPRDPAWLAEIVFKRLGLPPLDLSGAAPTFQPSLNAVILQRLEAIRPKHTRPAAPPRPGGIKSEIGIAPWSEPVQLLDLAAPAPALPRAGAAPATLSLAQAWFYKDLNREVRDLVELGDIMGTGLAFQHPHAFRKIAAGETPNGIRTWFRSIRFPQYEKAHEKAHEKIGEKMGEKIPEQTGKQADAAPDDAAT